ncbi:MAG: hypothetical protein HOP20_05985 [Sulfuriferula sp.]|nr:hypothetical protein [Sulfuriferula sp.]
MQLKKKVLVCLVGMSGISSVSSAMAGEWTTEVDLDYRYFRKPPAQAVANSTQQAQAAAFYQFALNAGFVPAVIPTVVAAQAAAAASGAGTQGNNQPSVVIQPSYFNEWADKTNSFSFKPFFRWDNMDDARTHADIREMVWTSKRGTESKPWELKVGIDKVFWGAAESQHLVDVINQTDEVENINKESKLGQPMVHASMVRDWGKVEAFVMPFFRERTFSGPDGRLRPLVSFDTLPNVYQSSDGRNHVDFAVRWSKSFGNTDVGVSQFIGTNRDPRLISATSYVTTANPAGLYLSYDQMEQTSIDVTSIFGRWIGKLEALHRTTDYAHYYAYVTGVEYAFTGVFKTPYDVNAFLEYNYDSRGQGQAIYQSDVFTGLRLSLNDANSTQIKLGVLTDTNDSSRSTRLQVSRRLNDHWTTMFEGQWFNSIDSGNPLNAYREDSYLQATLARYF